MMRRYADFATIVTLIGMVLASFCQAEEIPAVAKKSTGLWDTLSSWKLPDTVQIHGFASQSYVHTSGNEFFGHSTNMGSLDFTEMGLNGSWRPLSQLQASMQLVYRRAGRTDNQNVRLDFGFLDYSVIADADNLLGVRGGRVFNPYGLYNDTRDMPFTRPSIFLPQSIYFDINRNYSLSGDGLQLYGEHRTEIGDFSLQINGMYPRADDPDLNQLIRLSSGTNGSLSGELSWMGRLTYEGDNGKFRFSVTSAEINAKFNPNDSAANSAGHLSFSPILFSTKYTAEKWGLAAEYALRPVSLSGFGPPAMSNDTTGESYYVQGHYRILPQWEALLRYDVLYSNRHDRSGKIAEAAGGGPAYNYFAKDITFGLRYDVTSWWMLRAEYHRINGSGWTPLLENQDPLNGFQQHWDMFAVSTSFRF
jgi:hypothetical protein